MSYCKYLMLCGLFGALSVSAFASHRGNLKANIELRQDSSRDLKATNTTSKRLKPQDNELTTTNERLNTEDESSVLDCRNKKNYFFATEHVRYQTRPDFDTYPKVGSRESNAWKAAFPGFGFLIYESKQGAIPLSTVCATWNYDWQEKDSTQEPFYIDNEGDKRTFNLARGVAFFSVNDPVPFNKITLKKINYWLPSLKYQGAIEEFIDVGWFVLVRQSHSSCYWSLISVGTIGIDRLPW